MFSLLHTHTYIKAIHIYIYILLLTLYAICCYTRCCVYVNMSYNRYFCRKSAANISVIVIDIVNIHYYVSSLRLSAFSPLHYIYTCHFHIMTFDTPWKCYVCGQCMLSFRFRFHIIIIFSLLYATLYYAIFLVKVAKHYHYTYMLRYVMVYVVAFYSRRNILQAMTYFHTWYNICFLLSFSHYITLILHTL